MAKMNYRLNHSRNLGSPDPKGITAKFPGRCATCKRTFVVGATLITRNVNGKWVHAGRCPKKR